MTIHETIIVSQARPDLPPPKCAAEVAHDVCIGDAWELPAAGGTKLLVAASADVRAADPHVVELHVGEHFSCAMSSLEEVHAAGYDRLNLSLASEAVSVPGPRTVVSVAAVERR